MNPPASDVPPGLPAWIQTVIGQLNSYIEFTWNTGNAEAQFATRLEAIGDMNLTYSGLAARIADQLERKATIDPGFAGSTVTLAANLAVQAASAVNGFPANILVHFSLDRH